MDPTNILEIGEERTGEIKVPVGSDQPNVCFAHQLTGTGGLPWHNAEQTDDKYELPVTMVLIK